MANGFLETVEQHPVTIGLLAIAVVFLALRSSSGSSGSNGVAVYGGTSQPLDPNVAAIDEARINAGTQNISTISQLVNGLNTTNAEEASSLASTEAGLESSLATIAAEQEVEDSQTAAGVTINSSNNAASIAAAQITASTQSQQIAAAAAATKGQQALEQQLGQFKKDIARAQDNTNLFGDIARLGGKVLAFLGI